MVEKTRLKDIGYIAVSIILLITYFLYFGKDSIERYLEKRVIITEHEEKHVTIPPPGKQVISRCSNKPALFQQSWFSHKIPKNMTRDGNNITCIARGLVTSLLNALKELPTMKLTYSIKKQTFPSILILFMLIDCWVLFNH